ncbi:N-acetylneuraminate synthase [Coprobacter fastidiosus]|uniref:N-acetylneuraminate synthase n=1 Tax=Coprobacter fastidiosus TaxID=1099853 RepID=UPI0032093092
MNKVLIIAEAGVNHNGSIKIAKQLIDVAADAGVDYIKFQTFRTEKLVSKTAPKADYQIQNTGNDNSQYDMLKRLELSENDHWELIDYCNKKNVKFFSTAFDIDSVSFLYRLGLSQWKIPSGEITNFPYLRAIGKTRQPVILSTGMANLQEIEEAIKVLVQFGTTREEITLLHCTTEYPAPKNEVNLLAIQTLKNHFGLNVGYSDHTQGIEIPVAAVALGATVIEKHFTLSRDLEGPDHRASLEPNELKQMVQYIRNIEKALGNGIKIPSENEKKNIAIVRKSIVAARNIVQGERFTEDNITVKRPATGISPMQWENIIGKEAYKNFSQDEQIKL